MRRFSTFALLLGIVFFAQPLRASTITYRTDAELIALSERVVHARAVAQRVARGGPDGTTIYTVTTLRVLEDFTGADGDEIEVWELGGTIGDEVLYVGGAVMYVVGREYLVCLERGPHGMRSIAMGFSKFEVSPGAGADKGLKRATRDTAVIGGRVPAVERTLNEFRRLAATVTGRPSRRASAAPPAVEVSAEDPFTRFQGGWRWAQPDSGLPVRWYKNTTAAPPVAGDAVPQIQTALSAWTSPASATITLQYAGTTSQGVAKGPWTGIPSASGVITFEDPNSELAGLVLAIGGGAANPTPGSGGTIGGRQFMAFTRAYVIFQNAADLDDEFKTNVGFSRVLEHEIGHTIGLGHTDDDPFVLEPEANIMNSSCCFPETPVPPALGDDDLAGLISIYPTGPVMTVDQAPLYFGAVTTGAAFVSKTGDQSIRLTQFRAGAVTWTATADQPWLQVTPSSGSGSASLTVSVVSVPDLPTSGILVASISVSVAGAAVVYNSPIVVTLTLIANGTSAAPAGSVDTPAPNLPGVTGAVPFTGWAIDDVGVTRVMICRRAVPGEAPTNDPNCGGALQIFVGFAVFIDGARPDVQAAYPERPMNSRAGWGFMVLTNMLPDIPAGKPAGGNGTYEFFVYAQDVEGLVVLLGTRLMTCNNKDATKPFGAIDTPAQGGTAKGTSLVNFGWALTPQPKMIPLNGSTMTVLVDGSSVGTVNYNHERPDIESLFPNYQNTTGGNGAVGFRILDTTQLTNGLHTIAWRVVDDEGEIEGIGSRYFSVSNGVGALTAASVEDALSRDAPDQSVRTSHRSRSGTSIDTLPLEHGPLAGRRGWDLEAPLSTFVADARGRTIVRSEEVSRIELRLGGGWEEGYSRTSTGLAAMPIGSRLDPETGVFTWAPGVGFVGTYDLVFVRHGVGGVTRRDVRVILQPKGSHLIGPQVVVDLPRPQQEVSQPFVVTGWAADLTASAGTGIATVHVWAYPLAGGPPIFLGATATDGARPDVAAVHGEGFRESGYGLVAQGLTPGDYDLAVFPWSTETASFAPPRIVRVTVR